MPRGKPNGRSEPSAANRFLSPAGSRTDGQAIQLGDVCDVEQLWQLLEDAIAAGVSVTIGPTKRRTSICVSFYAQGESSPWYLDGREDWTDMLATTSV